MTKFDLISIGDNATDAFIRLSEAELNCQIDRPECKICMRFASKIPYESVTEIPAGGNSANVVLGTTKLGLQTSYLTQIGGDGHGQKTLAKLQSAGVNTDLITIYPDQPSNYNYVLWYQDDRTILVSHQNYTKIFPDNLPTPTWLYLSSVKDDDLSFHNSLADWLREHPETRLAFSPGSVQIKAGTKKLREIYEQTTIFFSNRQEAEKITGEDAPTENSSLGTEERLKIIAQKIKDLGPKIVVITDGENGSYCLDQENKFWTNPPAKEKALERTGAGDAFASAFLSAIFYNETIATALTWGTANAGSVITKIGPHEGLLSLSQIKEKL